MTPDLQQIYNDPKATPYELRAVIDELIPELTHYQQKCRTLSDALESVLDTGWLHDAE